MLLELHLLIENHGSHRTLSSCYLVLLPPSLHTLLSKSTPSDRNTTAGIPCPSPPTASTPSAHADVFDPPLQANVIRTESPRRRSPKLTSYDSNRTRRSRSRFDLSDSSQTTMRRRCRTNGGYKREGAEAGQAGMRHPDFPHKPS